MAKVKVLEKGKECCGSCQHKKDMPSDRINVLVSVCTRYPPQGSRPSLFPSVDLDWLCGEYEYSSK